MTQLALAPVGIKSSSSSLMNCLRIIPNYRHWVIDAHYHEESPHKDRVWRIILTPRISRATQLAPAPVGIRSSSSSFVDMTHDSCRTRLFRLTPVLLMPRMGRIAVRMLWKRRGCCCSWAARSCLILWRSCGKR